MKDEKMLKVVEIDYKKEKVKVDLDKLYLNTPSANADTPLQKGNIDITETLSNLTGKWIKKVKSEKSEVKSVVSEDGSEIDVENFNYKLIKPLIWWE